MFAPPGAFKAIISVGGDGTLLSASHSVEDGTPIIGFRSSNSSVGYLSAGGVDNVPQVLAAFKNDNLIYQLRHRIRAIVFKAENRSQVKNFSSAKRLSIYELQPGFDNPL